MILERSFLSVLSNNMLGVLIMVIEMRDRFVHLTLLIDVTLHNMGCQRLN